ncbi:MAG: hypothetical protein LBJ04_04075 [Sphingobacterium sp.]|jgi:hypothetical protein|nr:hypothetical protein [Sphingobacterium sp.]
MISKKIIKKSLIAVGSALTLTLGIAFAVNAMENKDRTEVLTTEEWQYEGTPGDLSQEQNPNNYVRPTGSLPCSTGSNICSVISTEDPSNPGHPQFSNALKDRIEDRDVSEADVRVKN